MTEGNDRQRPVVHDRRRIDPETGEVREPVAPGKAAQAAVAGVAKARAGREGGRPSKAGETDTSSSPEQDAPAADVQRDRAAKETKPAAEPTEEIAATDDEAEAATADAVARDAAAKQAAADAKAKGGKGKNGKGAAATDAAADDAVATGTEAKDAAKTGEEKIATLEATVAERTADLQRITAEYANYRKRVERDREAVKELARAEVFSGLLEALDDIGRAREHGELDGGFKSVAETLERVMQKFGVERYGEAGEPFDPTVHEALLHSYSGDVSEPTCTTILQPGYRIGERILRPARVAVTEPEPYDPSGGVTSD